MKNFLKLKINRFFESRKILKLKYYIHKIFKEKDIGDLGFNFDDKPNFKKYLGSNLKRVNNWS